jgi:hypothetical protein
VNWDLNEDQRMVRDMVREFVDAEIVPHAGEWDQEARFPEEVFRELGELGLFGMNVPEEYGGAGLDGISSCLVLEELARGDASTCVAISVTNSVFCAPILMYGTEEQKQRWLVPCASGEWLGAFSLSEPDVGSDAGALRAVAERHGDEYVLNGSKAWVTSGEVCGALVVFALTDPEAKRGRISGFIVPRDTEGVVVIPKEHKMGIRSSPTNQISFEDCRVPVSQRLGAEGQGLEIALRSLDGGRAGIAAQAVGIAQAALEASLGYVQEREAFGRPIGLFEGLQGRLVQMAAEIRAARCLYLRAAALRASGQPDTTAASEAKLFASEMANRATYEAVQIHGGYGYVADYPVERLYRDARVTTIYEGTSEIQRLVIARTLLSPDA